MKYCSPCKQRAKDEDEKCTRCGGPLRAMGVTPGQQRSKRPSPRQAQPTGTTGRPSEKIPIKATRDANRPPVKPQSTSQETPQKDAQPADVQYKLAGLESKVRSSSLRVKILAAVAILLAVSFTGLLFYLRHSYIMQFAEVETLEIIRSEAHTGTALIRFRPLTEGRIQFVRSGGGRQETLLEYSSGPTPEGEFRQFHWTGDADGSWTISVRHRDGSSLIDRDWQSAQKGSKKSGGPGVLAAL